MRRKEREIVEQKEIEKIISKAAICRIALSADDQPYLVPLCFGYRDNTLFFHSATKGKKVEMMQENPRVCFEIEGETEIIKADKACNWGMRYTSVIGYGNAVFVDDTEAKSAALDVIMSQYASEKWEYPPKNLARTLVFKVEIEYMTGKTSGD